MTETVKLKLKINSDPYRLILSIQSLAPSDIDSYIETQAKRIARNDAINEVSKEPHGSARYEVSLRLRRVNRYAEEFYIKRLSQLSKYKIKIIRTEQINDELVEITGERL